MDVVIGILIIFGIALAGTLVFGGWVIVAVVRLIARVIGSLLGPTNAPLPALPVLRCGHPRCRADNPARARFCRRCGRMLHSAGTAAVRRVAVS